MKSWGTFSSIKSEVCEQKIFYTPCIFVVSICLMLKPWWKSAPSPQIASVADWQMPVIGDRITPCSSPSPSTSLRTGFDLHSSTNRMRETLSEKDKAGCIVIFLCNKLYNLPKDPHRWFHFICNLIKYKFACAENTVRKISWHLSDSWYIILNISHQRSQSTPVAPFTNMV